MQYDLILSKLLNRLFNFLVFNQHWILWSSMVENMLLLRKDYFVLAVDNFLPVVVNMLLLNRNRLGQNIKTSSHEVNITNFMISHDAKDSFVIVAADSWIEVDLHSHEWLSFDNAFRHRKPKTVVSIRDELEADWQIRVVMNVEDSVCAAWLLHFSKMDWFDWKLNIITIGLAFASKLQLISTLSWNFIISTRNGFCNCWSIFDGYNCALARS